MISMTELERMLFRCPKVNISKYPQASYEEFLLMDHDFSGEYVCVYPFVRMDESGTPYVEIYVWDSMLYPNIYERFIICEGMRLTDILEEKLLNYCREPLLCIDYQRMNSFNYALLECFPQWHCIEYSAENVGRCIEHIYYASHRSGPREIFYQAGLENIAYNINQLPRVNLIGTTVSAIIGHNLPIKQVRVGIAYDGWKQTGKGRYELPDKVVVAGFEGAKKFHEYREAAIAEKYNLDEVNERILNADGASWIRKVKDKSTRFQLDPFHRNKAVREKIHDAKAAGDIMGLLEEEKTGELFDYLEAYINSLGEDREIEDAKELLRYYRANEDGLLPYQSQGIKLPGHPEGLEYRDMGTMENHVWSVIARRMKLKCPVFEEEKVEELYGEILMSAKAPWKDGKGYEYPVIGHMVGLEGRIRGDHRKLLRMAGF